MGESETSPVCLRVINAFMRITRFDQIHARGTNYANVVWQENVVYNYIWI